MTEAALTRAVQAAVGRWDGVALREYTSAESVLDPSPRPGPPYYIVLLELENGEVTAKQAGMVRRRSN